jgi:signal transduction histidine kinase
MVVVHKPQIQQVLLNLLLNACDAMNGTPANERLLTVSVATEGGDRARVCVRDRGAGLADDQLERVFDGFYTTKPGGLGIGLALSRSIVESHGGALSVERNSDRGATFSFTLPCSAGEARS